MKRLQFEARKDFEQSNVSHGFDYGKLDDVPYWNETAGYELTSKEVDNLYEATATLYSMLTDAAQKILDHDEWFSKLGLSDDWRERIQKSWNDDEKSIYGRFDLWFDGSEIKLLEFNGDTPTSLLETSITQYYWMKDRGLPDQFNGIHEALIESWKWMKDNEAFYGDTVHFMCAKHSPEDFRNTEYMMDTAKQAGLDVKFILADEIGTDQTEFYDVENKRIYNLFKLYPWEWLIKENFGDVLCKSGLVAVEPSWKMLMSSKAILPVLWKLYPQHRLLLPSFFAEDIKDPTGYVAKPIWGREGRDVDMQPSEVKPGYIYQQRKDLPDFGGYKPVVGSWIIGGEPKGVGIREDKGLVTGNTSQFTPHYFK